MAVHLAVHKIKLNDSCLRDYLNESICVELAADYLCM